MNRVAKQIVYATAFVLFILLVAWLFYFAYGQPEPSCYDKVRNQDEEGIDCGGVCGNLCFPENFRPLETASDVLVLKIDSTQTSFLARVQNPNPELAAQSFRYSFDLKDLGGNLIQSVPGSSYIYPSEIKTLILPNFHIEAGKVGFVDLSLADPVWVKSESFIKPVFRVQNQKTSMSSSSLKIEGRVVSEESFIFYDVEVVAVLKNNAGRIVGVSKTRIDSLKPRESKPFVIIHPNLPEVNLNLTEVLIYSKRS